MKKISRRNFLKQLGAAGMFGTLYNFDLLTLSAGLAEAAGEDYQALVCISLNGGNDGNNTVIPLDINDYSAYAAVRGALAIPAADLIPLIPGTGNTAYGLHPQLAPLRDIWNGGAMALLFNVGTLAEPTTQAAYRAGLIQKPDGLFSHADQQILWQGTGPDAQLRSGWGGRVADQLTGINNGASTPLAISVAGDTLYITGENTRSLSIPAVGGFKLAGFSSSAANMARRSAFDQLLTVGREATITRSAGDTITRALASSQVIDPVLTSNTSAIQSLFTGQNNAIAQQLLQTAKLIEARAVLGVKKQIFFISMGGFDTHGNQLAAQSDAFAQLAPALKAFYDATVQLGVASKVTTFTTSDFGRTLQPNTDNGTDHGWGSHHFIIGGGVRGREYYGQYPVLALNGPDDAGKEGRWIPTTAVDQYAATLATWFGISASDLSRVVPNIGRFASANLGFMA